MKNAWLIGLLALASCAQSDTMRTSSNEMVVSTRAAPICGGMGAAKVAQRVAAIETLKAGYDRYVILGADRYNDVRTVQMPGQYNTFGTATTYGGMTSINATTTYTPGPTFVAGGHHQSLRVRMFREGEPGANNALSARAALGPEWERAVKNGVSHCGD
ncbi:hypothetical protein [Ciceribacter sp. L1K22]|uniref:hypothetical protein n=1 Tax=Ciceribacter sp. L1K22 TaxID=2820275 RepID=UPI001ABDAF2E|nr:hypothetical protein [Ciceribacter sp. L1K22]MBO3760353.1 hypothetical protein [Ciceribacter sp. L1K22]